MGCAEGFVSHLKLWCVQAETTAEGDTEVDSQQRQCCLSLCPRAVVISLAIVVPTLVLLGVVFLLA